MVRHSEAQRKRCINPFVLRQGCAPNNSEVNSLPVKRIGKMEFTHFSNKQTKKNTQKRKVNASKNIKHTRGNNSEVKHTHPGTETATAGLAIKHSQIIWDDPNPTKIHILSGVSCAAPHLF